MENGSPEGTLQSATMENQLADGFANEFPIEGGHEKPTSSSSKLCNLAKNAINDVDVCGFMCSRPLFIDDYSLYRVILYWELSQSIMGISYEPAWISKMLDDNPQPICEPWCWNMNPNICPNKITQFCR